jgi:hypothetical protein
MGHVRKDASNSSETIITKVAEACEERIGLSQSTIRDVFKGIRIKFYLHSINPGNEVFVCRGFERRRYIQCS